MAVNRELVDLETGEVINSDNLVLLSQGDKIVRRASIDFLKSVVTIPMKEFVCLDQMNLIKLVDVLERNELILFLEILPFVNFSGNCLGSSRKPMKKETLQQESTFAIRTFNKAFKGLLDKRVIAYENNMYFINPYIVSKGKKTFKSTLNLFKGSVWEDEKYWE